jgi:hypothetical protein
MSRFYWRAAWWAFAGMFLLIALLSVAAGVKECGSLVWGLYFVGLSPIIFIKFPWVFLIIVLVFGLVGFTWSKPVFRRLWLIVFAILLVAVPAAADVVTPHTSVPCQPI